MAQGDVLINLVLDQSGSMMSVAPETVDGVNAFLEEQRSVIGDAYLTLTLFDSNAVVRYHAGDLALVPPFGSRDNSYQPSGGTALYDGVGNTIEAAEKWLAENPSFDGQILVAIVTDGAENASRRWTLDMLNTAIGEKKEAGWEFVFMGSGGAAWTEGGKLDINPGMVVNYMPSNTAGTYATFSTNLATSRTANTTLAQTFTRRPAADE